MFALFRIEFHWIAIRLRRSAAMDAGEVAGLSDFPNSDEWAFAEIDGVDLLVHKAMRQPHFIERRDQSPRLLEFTE